ncbi:hypothetical protein ACWD26_22150 [Streptomyces sp. NPDC002787]
MLLHSLVQRADSREDAVPDYHQRRPVMWQIELSSSGDSEPLIIDLRPATGDRPRQVTAPYTGRSGRTPPPCPSRGRSSGARSRASIPTSL